MPWSYNMKKIIKFIVGIAFIAGLSLVYAATHLTQSLIQGAFSSTTGSVNPQVVLAFPSGAGGTTTYVTNGITNLTYFKLLTGVYPSPLIGTPPASYNVTNAFNI